jgi:hypothetical protein
MYLVSSIFQITAGNQIINEVIIRMPRETKHTCNHILADLFFFVDSLIFKQASHCMARQLVL